MFDFDWSKLALMGIVALIFIPAKDLPRVLRQVGQLVGNMRRMAAEFQGQIMEAVREADVASLKDDLNKIKDSAKIDLDLQLGTSTVANEIKAPAEPVASAAPVEPVVALNLPPVAEVPAPVMPAETIAEPPKVRRKKPVEGEAATPSPRKRATKAAVAEDRQA